MAPSKMPKPTEETKDFFASFVPDHPAVRIRPMFGQLSAFVNGNMFMGIFGEDVLVRLPEEDRREVLGAGGRVFEPMQGRPMRESGVCQISANPSPNSSPRPRCGYVVLPGVWQDEPDCVRQWAARSLDHAEELPPEQPRKKPKKR